MRPHTPGPWDLERIDDSPHGQFDAIVWRPGGVVVCRAPSSGPFHDGNAALIAAAPQLAEALRECIQSLDWLASAGHANSPLNQTVKKAEAALRSAGLEP